MPEEELPFEHEDDEETGVEEEEDEDEEGDAEDKDEDNEEDEERRDERKPGARTDVSVRRRHVDEHPEQEGPHPDNCRGTSSPMMREKLTHHLTGRYGEWASC